MIPDLDLEAVVHPVDLWFAVQFVVNEDHSHFPGLFIQRLTLTVGPHVAVEDIHPAGRVFFLQLNGRLDRMGTAHLGAVVAVRLPGADTLDKDKGIAVPDLFVVNFTEFVEFNGGNHFLVFPVSILIGHQPGCPGGNNRHPVLNGSLLAAFILDGGCKVTDVSLRSNDLGLGMDRDHLVGADITDQGRQSLRDILAGPGVVQVAGIAAEAT